MLVPAWLIRSDQLTKAERTDLQTNLNTIKDFPPIGRVPKDLAGKDQCKAAYLAWHALVYKYGHRGANSETYDRLKDPSVQLSALNGPIGCDIKDLKGLISQVKSMAYLLEMYQELTAAPPMEVASDDDEFMSCNSDGDPNEGGHTETHRKPWSSRPTRTFRTGQASAASCRNLYSAQELLNVAECLTTIELMESRVVNNNEEGKNMHMDVLRSYHSLFKLSNRNTQSSNYLKIASMSVEHFHDELKGAFPGQINLIKQLTKQVQSHAQNLDWYRALIREPIDSEAGGVNTGANQGSFTSRSKGSRRSHVTGDSKKDSLPSAFGCLTLSGSILTFKGPASITTGDSCLTLTLPPGETATVIFDTPPAH